MLYSMEVICLPGLDGTGQLFAPFLAALPKEVNARAIAYPSKQILSYAALVDYVIEQLPVDSEYMLIGESFSGPLAYMIATRNLKNLKAIVFVASFLRSPRPVLLPIFCFLPIAFLLSIPSPRFLLRYFTLGLGCSKGLQRQVYQAVKSVELKVLASRFHEINRLKLNLHELPQQLAYIQANQDRVVPKSNFKLFAKLGKTVKLYKINGAHMIMQTRPERCAAVIVSELQRYANSRGND